MTYETRPRTRNGRSRPPLSRFQEGSMNDRASAAPPAQFLGPEQLKDYEKQFYTEPITKSTTTNTTSSTTTATTATTTHHERQLQHRRDRPLSAAAQLESPVAHRTSTSDESRTIAHKKSTGFFGRVRDALFSSSRASSKGGGGVHPSQQPQQQQERDAARKHSSLQEPLVPPRPDYLRAAKSHSEIQIPQLASRGGGGAGADRPSREDVLQSYNQLMATGFFQSHAIQSTRHAGPARRSAPLPSIPSVPCSPEPPPRSSSIQATALGTPAPAASPVPPPRMIFADAPRGDRMEPPPLPGPLAKRESRLNLRGRKRSRADAEDSVSASATTEAAAAAAVFETGTSSFAQPLKRVAKKLRKMPSSSGAAAITPVGSGASVRTSTDTSSSSSAANTTSDGTIRLPPSVSSGGTLRTNDKPIRMRSPSPAVSPPSHPPPPPPMPQYAAPGIPTPAARRAHRRTFSSNGGGGRERGEGGNRLRKRGRSPPPPVARKATGPGKNISPETTWETMAGEDRMSLDTDDGALPRDSGAREQGGGSNMIVYPGPADTETQQQQQQQQSPLPLSVVPDANRGIPSVPRIPRQYYYFHHKDRGSGPSGKLVASDNARWARGDGGGARGDDENRAAVVTMDVDDDFDVDAVSRGAAEPSPGNGNGGAVVRFGEAL
ncbi:hypothetical protein F4778DRAFT_461478 [Xylariomycetidae sp. FL2044]|nr:hypothetical protein F4778DRAFT_461478 [Xylariomycetidae sp. FL2044]